MFYFFLNFIFVSSALPPFYHTTSSMFSSLLSLNCPSLSVLPTSSVQAFHLASDSRCSTFLLFGEHPRELISSELGFHVLSEICSKALPLLSSTSLTVVLNANPKSRESVEEGDFCLRTNENGVDINRNWDSHWKAADCRVEPELCPGPFPFSEPETQELRDLLENSEADLFITVHSGKYAMLYPFAYSEKPIDAEKALAYEEVLKEVAGDDKVPVGEAADVLNYRSYGTCVDYAYEELAVDYCFAWEIYEEEEKAKSFLQQNDCFSQFNPAKEEDYNAIIEKWTERLMKTISLVCSKY
jgi:hypothetical protein